MQSGKDEKNIFGNKAANLIKLEAFLKNISNDNIHCEGEFIGFSGRANLSHDLLNAISL